MVFLAYLHKTRIFVSICQHFWHSIPAYYPHFRKQFTRIIPAFWQNLTRGRLWQHWIWVGRNIGHPYLVLASTSLNGFWDPWVLDPRDQTFCNCMRTFRDLVIQGSKGILAEQILIIKKNTWQCCIFWIIICSQCCISGNIAYLEYVCNPSAAYLVLS